MLLFPGSVLAAQIWGKWSLSGMAIIRATTADERGNLTYEHEGAYTPPILILPK